ncbi:pilin [Candidatus Venteria ishoeyi]|uniref:Fimbrial protein n=1 Tax=Candidatus Venteria ishoeyi TaxID=1899563 RepID=A0A1H6FET7_9GAMM|nr:pilin [Candidatus Venteria ishoeyi]SEH08582.1 Fimbrial protein precursor [Candidatus Venteria ishoeyi]
MKQYMKKIPTGFTIVELMVVVAVIGVLASIAIPIYRDYIDRGKVSEAMQLLSGVRIPLQEYLIERGTWPSIETVGAKEQGKYTTSIVSGKYVKDSKNVYYAEATMRGDSSTSIGGKKVRMIYLPGARDWDCTVEDIDANEALDYRYLPSACKD